MGEKHLCKQLNEDENEEEAFIAMCYSAEAHSSCQVNRDEEYF